MAYSNRDLVNRFANGKKSGQSSNMKIVKMPDGSTVLEGYDWAAYAWRKNNGSITVYNGWYGYSQSTSKHLNLVKPKADKVSQNDPETDDLRRDLRGSGSKSSGMLGSMEDGFF